MKRKLLFSGMLVVMLCRLAPLSAQEVIEGGEQAAPIYAQADTGVANTDAVQVHYRVDRTAIFPGDKINFYLQIICAAGVDILPEDLDPGRIDLTGLELVDSDQTVTVDDGRRTYHVRHTYTTYDLDTPALQIGAQTIRYYVQQEGSVNQSGELVIAPIPLSLRSTLAAGPMQSRLRDGESSGIVPGGMQWTGTAGLLLILLSGTPLGWWVVGWMRSRATNVRQHETERTSVHEERGILDRLAHMPVASETDRRLGYDQLDRLLRDILAQSTGIVTAALTPEELATSLAGSRLAVPLEQLLAVMSDCEQARYGRSVQVPDATRFGDSVELARRLLFVR